MWWKGIQRLASCDKRRISRAEHGRFLYFHLVGVIITIMLNENIWDEFLPGEKTLLNFIMLLQIITCYCFATEFFL